ncbi:hypothetical protein [Nannocystis pusilla]|uniref:Lipoprotein n=1 Tax=Nannocystis pusilla TaxID=889268 RepID=A0ABS7U5Q3_9BACT|nr:hypothetical protein [Nannocystis pusilla]MBZ5715903.1 hypothetical protein [Nannocystis pusilla]
MSSSSRSGLVLAFTVGLALPLLAGCTDRAQGEDEVVEACKNTCPLQFECGFADEDNTLEKCLEGCPDFLRAQRKECEAYFDLKVCLGQVSCQEYSQYQEALDRPIGTFSDAPEYPCQAEVVAQARQCYGVEDP